MTYKAISDYGVIGDMHSAALVGVDGSIDWLCFPRFDSPSVFGAILDDERGGRFRICPSGQYRSTQEYAADSNILLTHFSTDTGAVDITDFMPISHDVMRSPHEVVRMVRCLSGSVEMDILFQPQFDYGRSSPEVSSSGRLAVARHGQHAVSLLSNGLLESQGAPGNSRFRLSQGEQASFLLTWENDSPREDWDPYTKLGRTDAFWRFVSHDWRYTGRWEKAVKRSMLALHTLLYVPTGAVCAAATTSLPEQIGGERNWDYRFCWLRDAAFTMDVFHRLGHTAYTRPFIQWLSRLALGSEVEAQHVMYGIGHEASPENMKELTLDHLEGYRGSRPARIGNAAFQQFQLDVFGEVMLALDSYQRAGGLMDEPMWALAESLVEAAIRNWQRPDHGIWEFRTEPKHFVFSKLMAWVAVDRGIRLAMALRRPVDFDRWRKTRAAIRQDILDKGWNPRRGSFVQHYGAENLGASLLFMPMVGFLPPNDPRVTSTIEAIRKELTVDGLVRRYLQDDVFDGVTGDEGTFTMCSLWLAGSLVAADRLDEAKAIFEKVINFSNHLGLFSEMMDPYTGEYLGNYPQAFTHIALIHTAKSLDRALNKRQMGKVVAA